MSIDKASRAMTLKPEDGSEWTFVAGPEVENSIDSSAALGLFDWREAMMLIWRASRSDRGVEALCTGSGAVVVEPAPKVSGTVSMKITAVALGVGAECGTGTLTMYDGASHEVKVSGVSLADVGAAEGEASGEECRLVEAGGIEGGCIAAEADGALVGGGAAVSTRTSTAWSQLKSRQKGVRLTLAGEALKITLQ